jgi:hypothetical protein
VLLGVHGENTAAHAFYARQGYTRAGVRKFQVGANVYDDLVLALALRTPGSGGRYCIHLGSVLPVVRIP